MSDTELKLGPCYFLYKLLKINDIVYGRRAKNLNEAFAQKLCVRDPCNQKFIQERDRRRLHYD